MVGSDDVDNPLDLARGAKPRTVALLRFVIFLVAAAGLTVGGVLGAARLLGLPLNFDQAPPLRSLIPSQMVQAVAVVLPTVVMAGLAREPAVRLGWGGSGRLRQLAIGLLTGLAGMAALLGLIALGGGVRSWTFLLSPDHAVLNGLGYALVFALVAVSGEGLLRGYGLVQLSSAISFWPATILTGVLFLLTHLSHRTESPVGLAQVGVIGAILAYSFRRSGALWFALGVHAAWDFAESWIFGVPDSGHVARGVLSRLDSQGPVWLTGGVTGPEASWLVYPVLGAIALVARLPLPLWTASRPAPGSVDH